MLAVVAAVAEEGVNPAAVVAVFESTDPKLDGIYLLIFQSTCLQQTYPTNEDVQACDDPSLLLQTCLACQLGTSEQ